MENGSYKKGDQNNLYTASLYREPGAIPHPLDLFPRFFSDPLAATGWFCDAMVSLDEPPKAVSLPW